MKRRKHRKKHKKIIIFSMVGIFFFFSVGYAAFGTDFLISGKGTIMSKPIAPEELKEKEVSTGDGIYKDIYDEGRYFYKGGNPNNYIDLDGQIYRIVSVEEDNVVKVIKQEKMSVIPFDVGYSTSISGITSANSVSGTRYTSVSSDYCYSGGNETEYYGCSVWGSKTSTLDSNENNVTKMPKPAGSTNLYNLPNSEAYLNTYLNTTFYNTLSEKIKSKIVNYEFNVGPLGRNSGQTLETDIAQEKAYKWKGKIGLITQTDYLRASTNEKCISISDSYAKSDCYSNGTEHNYLFRSMYEWTITPYSSPSADSARTWSILFYGDFYGVNTNHENQNYFRPVFFLSSDIKLSGNGTEKNPYVIV